MNAGSIKVQKEILFNAAWWIYGFFQEWNCELNLTVSEKEFIKIALILFKLRELIKECYDKRNLSAESYYLDLKKDELLREAVISTTNYTNLVSEVTGKQFIS